ncbi:ArsR/SmtB family transcription factor [Streptomyces acidiscabies]|uniref:ArsR family transcriptional regulator n=1 Tax=Streptomyces acidiscabies TaxID=42234 RepID=A0A0L0JXF4_9ACTN|nr:helix-turn-helix transcriptional regulator [Streptomyces acidiscabies]KND30221.1 ArsR family transcriptional regulator [Streptomyces acidiscabies]GAQ58929.1 helix-turn-helix domain protein [Streptomyces acidiscabies]
MARTIDHPDLADVPLQQFLEALADPVRRDIVAQLARAAEDLSCGTFVTPVSLSTRTHHFNVLREAGVIRQYYVGTTKLNSLRADDADGRFPGLLAALLGAQEREADPAPRQ